MYNSSSPKSIQEMFATIAKSYDLTNALSTFGLYKNWNRSLIRAVKGADLLLDLCAGTGEIAFGFLKKNPKAHAILLDFCPEMLEIAKVKKKALRRRYCTVVADAENIPIDKACIDAVTLSYGIRNINNPDKCLSEVMRVLKPKGIFAILELTRPGSKLLNNFHRFYLRNFLPAFGKLTSKNPKAYKYLAQSIESFITPEEMQKKLEKVGFQEVALRSFLGGTTTLFIAKKN